MTTNPDPNRPIALPNGKTAVNPTRSATAPYASGPTICPQRTPRPAARPSVPTSVSPPELGADRKDRSARQGGERSNGEGDEHHHPHVMDEWDGEEEKRG